MNKSTLKKGYYYEFKNLYDTLPDELEIIENCKQIDYDRTVTEREILKEYAGKLSTFEQACGYVLRMIDSLKMEIKWNLVFFEQDGVPCRLYFGLGSDGVLSVNVRKVIETIVWDSPRVGFPLCNKNSESSTMTLSPSDALTLESAVEMCKKAGYRVLRTKTVEEEL